MPVTTEEREMQQVQVAMYLCAWCHIPLDLPPGRLRGEPAQKHGMCLKCLLERLARLVEELAAA